MSSDDDRARGMRLRQARAERFDSAADAARALNISKDTYVQHENGIRGFKRLAERYASFYRINFEWLWTGRGQMRSGKAAPPEWNAFDVAEAFNRAPAGVRRIVEGILKDAGSLSDEEKRRFEKTPDVSYAQAESEPLSLEDRPPERPRGLPIDKTGLDQPARDAALARLAKLKRKPKRR